ncbi:hypothetical protein ACQPW1_12005 [Nocardia sp. CA-128927]|uniref:hypothetical protein n=1 Tax=Nocardia sp. CA-128927 TaxID=3239975 RepID=UPI003D99417A
MGSASAPDDRSRHRAYRHQQRDTSHDPRRPPALRIYLLFVSPRSPSPPPCRGGVWVIYSHGRAAVVVGFFNAGGGVVVRCGLVCGRVVVGGGVVVFGFRVVVVAVGHPVGFGIDDFVGCGVVVSAGTTTVTVDGFGGVVPAGTITVTVDGPPSETGGGGCRDTCTETLPLIEKLGPGPAVGVSAIVDGTMVSVGRLVVSVATGSPLTFSIGAESITVTVAGAID